MKVTENCPRCHRPVDALSGLCIPCSFSLVLSNDEGLFNHGKIISAAMPRELGDHELLEEIDRGGMGIVFKARHRKLNRQVALKVLTSGAFASAEMIQRFKAEADLVASLNHPHIVTIYEIGDEGGEPYFTMELIEGPSLNALADEGKLSIRDSVQIMAKIAAAVHHAHQRGILHRDLKPSNILIDKNGEPHLTDFGISKLMGFENARTQTHLLFGTPSYVAPEVARGEGKSISTAVDVYGIGAVLYHLLTGSPPFNAGNSIETLRQVAEVEPRPPSLFNADVHRDLETITLKCLRKDPEQRYSSAEAVAEDLHRYLRDEPITARPLGMAERTLRFVKRNVFQASLLALAMLFFLGGLAGVLWQWSRAEKERSTAVSARNSAELVRKQAQTERDNFRVQLYSADIQLCQQLLEEGSIDRAARTLQQYFPIADGTDLRGVEWYYLWNRIHATPQKPSLKARLGHDVQFYREDQMCASLEKNAAQGPAVVLRSNLDGSIEKHFSSSDAFLTVYCIEKSGRYLFLGGSSGRLEKLSVADKKTQWTQLLPGKITRLLLSPNQERIAAFLDLEAGRHEVILLEADSGHRVITLERSVSDSGIFSSDALSFFYSGTNRYLSSYPPAAGSDLSEWPTYDRVTSIAQSSLQAKTRWIIGLNNGGISIPGNQGGHLQAHSAKITGLAFIDHGRHFISVGEDHLLKVWDAELRRLVKCSILPEASDHQLAPLNDGTSIAVISDGRCQVFKREDLLPSTPREILKQAVQGYLNLSPNGEWIASTAGPGVGAWAGPVLQNLRTGDSHSLEEGAYGLGFNSIGTRYFACRKYHEPESHEFRMKIIQVNLQTQEQTNWPLHLEGRSLVTEQISPDAKWIIATDYSAKGSLWDLANGRKSDIQPPAGLMTAIAFAPDGLSIVSGDPLGAYRIRSFPGFSLLGSWSGESAASRIHFINSNVVLVADVHGQIEIRSVPDGTFIRKFKVGNQPPGVLASSSDGKTIAFAERGPTGNMISGLKFWNLESGRELLTFDENYKGLGFLPEYSGFIGSAPTPTGTVIRIHRWRTGR